MIAKRLTSGIASSNHLLERATRGILHHRDDIFERNLARRRHFVNGRHRHAQMLSQTRKNRDASVGQLLQSVQLDLASIHHSQHRVGSAVHIGRIAATSGNGLTDVLKHADGLIALNPGIRQRAGRLLVRLILDRRPRRDPLQPLKGVRGFLRVPVETRQHQLPLLLVDSRLDATDNSGTHSRAHRNTSRDRATLSPLPESARKTIPRLLARLIRLPLSLIEILTKLIAKLRGTGNQRNIRSR